MSKNKKKYNPNSLFSSFKDNNNNIILIENYYLQLLINNH